MIEPPAINSLLASSVKGSDPGCWPPTFRPGQHCRPRSGRSGRWSGPVATGTVIDPSGITDDERSEKHGHNHQIPPPRVSQQLGGNCLQPGWEERRAALPRPGRPEPSASVARPRPGPGGVISAGLGPDSHRPVSARRILMNILTDGRERGPRSWNRSHPCPPSYSRRRRSGSHQAISKAGTATTRPARTAVGSAASPAHLGLRRTART